MRIIIYYYNTIIIIVLVKNGMKEKERSKKIKLLNLVILFAPKKQVPVFE